ncbi:MAG: signal recognition particle-docking protein FtsY [Deferribacterota bacterium]|nr:signal recognition particle-docking protein FtsY [Deferribacterota bacterium]
MAIFDLFKSKKKKVEKKDKEKIEKGLKNSSSNLIIGINKVAKRGKIDEEAFEELEELLLTSDISFDTTYSIINSLKKNKIKSVDGLKEVLKEKLINILDIDNSLCVSENKPYVILVVGVNGVGKTTSIAKLANLFSSEGLSVALAACDTFRAAAGEQLEVWANRLSVPIVKKSQGSDPSSVLYEAINYSKSNDIDVLIVDTAGRIHTKSNLMRQLEKIARTANRLIDDAPHEILLTIDASMGQNVLEQARTFKKEIDLTGIILTKLDGTAKGGVAISVVDELSIPIKFIGTGEKVDDIAVFDSEVFVKSLLS